MRTICMQLQAAWNSPELLAAVSKVLANSKARRLAVTRGGKKHPYVNIQLETSNVRREWQCLSQALRRNRVFARYSIVTCTGKSGGWDDYETLWHMDRNEIDPRWHKPEG